MATIERHVEIHASAGRAWKALSDFDKPHKLFKGVLLDARMEGAWRLVTFSDGRVVKELLVTLDERCRRLVYSATGGAAEHHNSSFVVVDAGAGRCEVTWISDFLPDTLTPVIENLVERGISAMKRTLELHD